MAIFHMSAAAVLTIAVLAGTAAPAEAAADEAGARAAIKAAKSAVAKNRRETADWGLWKDTLDHLANAEKALKGGDFAAAAQKADRARFEAEMGLAQIKQQTTTWRTAAKYFEEKERAWVAGQDK